MKLASIETITNIRPHPNADKLSLANVLGWQVVVQKDLHNEGDKIVFITIDSIVPKCSWSEFLVETKNPDKPLRVKNIKLRGEYSSGLVIPLKQFPAQFAETTVIGENLTELLGIKKYVKEIPAHLAGESIGDFPTHLASKTDEDNGLNDPELVKQVFESDSEITITQKLDGSSVSLIVENGELTQVCSRNLSKKETDDSSFWKAARKLTIPHGWSGVIQGELCGNGIQKNPLKLIDVKIFVFQIKIKDYYMTYSEMKQFCENELHCDVVPHIADLEVAATVKLWVDPLLKFQELADKQRYSSGEIGEGIVVRPKSYMRSHKSCRPLGFKLINRNYKD